MQYKGLFRGVVGIDIPVYQFYEIAQSWKVSVLPARAVRTPAGRSGAAVQVTVLVRVRAARRERLLLRDHQQRARHLPPVLHGHYGVCCAQRSCLVWSAARSGRRQPSERACALAHACAQINEYLRKTEDYVDFYTDISEIEIDVNYVRAITCLYFFSYEYNSTSSRKVLVRLRDVCKPVPYVCRRSIIPITTCR